MNVSSSATAIDVGFDALAKNEFAVARAAFERALSEGTGESALTHLGWLLEQGLGGDEDVPRAMALYKRAIEAEPEGAETYLGKVQSNKRICELWEKKPNQS